MKILYFVLSLSILAACSSKDISLCDQLRFVSTVPFKKESVDDDIYNGLISQGMLVVPCLIDDITNTNIMADPRKMAPYSDFREGDLAVFILLDITHQKIENFLPTKEKEKFITEGVWIYFDYVASKENRKELQNKWKKWLDNRNRAFSER